MIKRFSNNGKGNIRIVRCVRSAGPSKQPCPPSTDIMSAVVSVHTWPTSPLGYPYAGTATTTLTRIASGPGNKVCWIIATKK